MKWLRFPNAGEWAALVTLAIVGSLLLLQGGAMFNPGALNARSRTSSKIGGVSSHAELANKCAACHAPAWSKETMADRCIACHENVGKQLASGLTLHGKFKNGRDCRSCHTEHKGAQAAITHFHRFDHSLTAFPLTGAHTQANCRSCHKEEGAYKGTPTVCVSCHKRPEVPAVHKANYGSNCASCHTTTTFAGARFEHSAFPINHGTKRGRQVSCANCHANPSNYKSYTCYNCHVHQPAKIERIHARRNIPDLNNCVRCHRGKKRRKAELLVDRPLRVCCLTAP